VIKEKGARKEKRVTRKCMKASESLTEVLRHQHLYRGRPKWTRTTPLDIVIFYVLCLCVPLRYSLFYS